MPTVPKPFALLRLARCRHAQFPTQTPTAQRRTSETPQAKHNISTSVTLLEHVPLREHQIVECLTVRRKLRSGVGLRIRIRIRIRLAGRRPAAPVAAVVAARGSRTAPVRARRIAGVRGRRRQLCWQRGRHRGNPAIFAPAFDPLVRVLVQTGEVLPQLLVLSRHGIAFLGRGELAGQAAQRWCVELVLMRLQIPELGELLAAVVELAGERLDLLVDDFVRSDVAALREGLAADVAVVWAFTGVPALVGLQVAQLREALAARGLFAQLMLQCQPCVKDS